MLQLYLLNPSLCVDTLKDLTRFWLAKKVPENKEISKSITIKTAIVEPSSHSIYSPLTTKLQDTAQVSNVCLIASVIMTQHVVVDHLLRAGRYIFNPTWLILLTHM